MFKILKTIFRGIKNLGFIFLFVLGISLLAVSATYLFVGVGLYHLLGIPFVLISLYFLGQDWGTDGLR